MLNFSGVAVEPDAVISFLKKELQLRGLCRQLLTQELIRTEAKARGLTVSSEEIQAEADQFRLQRKLESADATFVWLEEQMLSPEEWEAGICDRLLAKKLAETMFEPEIVAFFIQNRLDYDQVVLYRLRVAEAPLAQELFYQISEAETSFYEAAHRYDQDERRRLRCGYEGTLFRWSLKPQLAAQVFGSQPQTVIGPLPAESGYELFMVERFILSELTSDVRERILERLFQEWLNRELTYLIHKDA
ncbi:MAG: peptidylprolyl isomerase [Leptolyngbya sp. SIO4C1]|nr:peptidylprolyl isomerase [Leptolyngbya sp. SIO4C1]